MSVQLTEKANEVLQVAASLANEHGNISIASEHLLLALLSDPQSALFTAVSKVAGADVQSIERAARRMIVKLPSQSPSPAVEELQLNPGLSRVIQRAQSAAKQSGDTYVAVDTLCVALLEEKDVERALSEAGCAKTDLVAQLKKSRGAHKVDSSTAESRFDALRKYAVNMVELAANGKLDPVVGRQAEMSRCLRILSRRQKNNPILCGAPGTGKTAIVEGLAQRIVRGDVPDSLNCDIWSLDVGALVAGASHAGEFEERLKAVLKEIAESERKIILFIDEVHLLIGAGQGRGAMDAANLLKPQLARGELRCIAATTIDEYRKYIEKDAAFERRFQPVNVAEPTVAETVSILRGLSEKYESHHGVKVADSALVLAATLSERYITNRFLPDKAIDALDEACANTRVQLDSQPEAIDTLQRRILQLEIEETALSREKDLPSVERLAHCRGELANLREQLRPLQDSYEGQRQRLEEKRSLNAKLEEIDQKILKAKRSGDLEKVVDLEYYARPEITQRLQQLESSPITAEQQQGEMVSETVGPEEICEVIARWTGIPVQRMNQSQLDRLLHLNDRLREKVIGQDEAVDAVAEAILRSRAGLGREQQPMGSFLFLGPTGTGKTQLAKSLCAELFDDEKFMVRIDMSEYMEQHSVARLIGAPPGYVGHDEGGMLTEKVRRQPYSVILFDEIEKAHPQVLTVLLQVLDDGRLTDGKGRTVDFSNTVIILTSNLGSEHILEREQNPEDNDDDYEELKERVMQDVRSHLRPEFINRLDDIVVFHALSRDNLAGIVRVQLQAVQQRLDTKRIRLVLQPEAERIICETAYDPAFGARPLRRYLEKYIVTPLSRMLLQGAAREGCTVCVGADTKNLQKLTFNVLETPNAMMEE